LLTTSRFALNRIASPGLGLERFLRLAQSVGLAKVELRNDLPGGRVHDDLSPERALAALDKLGIQVITINALQHFNLASLAAALDRELEAMIRISEATARMHLRDEVRACVRGGSVRQHTAARHTQQQPAALSTRPASDTHHRDHHPPCITLPASPLHTSPPPIGDRG
jgi:predicted xylose isomerase-like sugar epimerase